MILKQLLLHNFRNLINVDIFPNEKTNVFFGDNAQGKTSLLEAIWLLTGGKSFRGAKDSELIEFNSKKLKIDAHFFSQQRDYEATITIENNDKQITLNKINNKKPSDLTKCFYAVVFSPTTLSLIKDGPPERRKYLDTLICQIKPIYIKLINDYNKILIQRNALLKDSYHHPELLDTIDAWDTMLAKAGTQIMIYRSKYCGLVTKAASEIYKKISSKKEELTSIYHCIPIGETTNEQELFNEYLNKLKSSINTDLQRGFTTFGIHRDDIDFYLNKKQAKTYASQGQQRSIALCLKFAQAEIIEKETGEKPIILLDDVLSELDKKRKQFILSNIIGYQTFITCCEAESFSDNSDLTLFHIENGELTRG